MGFGIGRGAMGIGIGALLVSFSLIVGSSQAEEAGAGENLRTCGSKGFPLSVFEQPAGYQNQPTALAARLRREIKEDPWLMPKRGWRVVYKDQKWAELVSGKPKRQGNVWVSYRKAKGRWRGVSYWSSCWFEPVGSEGARPGEWFLSRKQKVGVETTSLKVDVYENDCNSGRPATGRVLAPKIEYRPKSIVVTYFIKPKKGPGFETCPSNPPVVKTLKLTEELGDRIIVDGGRYPYPRRVPAGARSPWG